MKWLTFISGLALTVSLGYCQNEPITVQLAKRDLTEKDQTLWSYASIGYGWLVQPSPKNSPKPPTAIGKSLVVNFTISQLGRNYIAGVFGFSSKDAKFIDIGYADWNRDGKFTANEKIVGRKDKENNQIILTPVEKPVIGNNPVDLQIQAYTNAKGDSITYATIVPRSVVEGSFELDGKSYKVALLDLDMDGKFVANNQASYRDMLAIDLDGNGTYDYTSVADEPEFVSPARWIVLPNHRYYELKSEKLDSAVFSPYAGQLGKIVIKNLAGHSASVLTEQNEVLPVYVEDGAIIVPTGPCRIYTYSFFKKDKEGKEWKATASDYNTKSSVIVTEDKPIDLGDPTGLKLGVGVNSTRSNFNFSLNLADGLGRSLSSLINGNNERPKEPKLKILDAKGTLVKELSFSYG